MPRLTIPLPVSALVAAATWLSPAGARALDVTAATGAAADIQAAVDQVAEDGGGTVYIPAGTFSFDEDVKAPDGVSLIGAGQDQTVLTGPGTIKIDTRHYGQLNQPFRISGLSLLDSGAAGIAIDTCSEFRIDHCTVQTSGGSAIGVANSTRGLIDHCTVDVRGNYYGVAVSGSDVWEDDIGALLGSPEGIFVEDCEFFGQGHSIVGHGAAHYVFRHNLVHPSDAHQIDAHGPGYGPDHGTRCVEVYGNTLLGPGWNGMGIRGGGGVVFDNLIQDHTHGVALVLESGSNTSSYPVPDQVHDMWIWDNTLQSVETPVIVLSLGGVDGGTATAEQFIQEGRDYFLQPKDGYQPFPYPHPYQEELGGDVEGPPGQGGGASSAVDAGSDGAGDDSGDGAYWGSPPEGEQGGCGCRTSPAATLDGFEALWLLLAACALGTRWGARRPDRVGSPGNKGAGRNERKESP